MEKITNRIFYKGKYDESALLSKLARIMAVTINLNDLTSKTLDELLNTIHIVHGSFLVLEKDDYKLINKDKEINLNNDQIAWLKTLDKPAILDESDQNIKQKMRDIDITLILPLLTKDNLEGLLLLGHKKTGESYSDQDIKVLEIFGQEMAVALENAKSYKEIQSFNITLEEEVKNATDNLVKANERLKELDRLKDEFFSLAAHELRTPLTAIRWNSSLLKSAKEHNLKQEDQDEMLNDIYKSSLRLIQIVNDYLDLSRIEQKKIKFKKELLDLPVITKTVVADIESIASSKGIYLKFNQPTVTIPKVIADPDRVDQILYNLIGNSVKFTDQGGVTVSITQDNNTVRYCIEDTGIGIAKDKQNLLFQKFQQAGEGGRLNQNFKGSGLGLYISRLLADAMGGKVWLEKSELNKGSLFCFSLPVANEEELKQVGKEEEVALVNDIKG